MIQKNIAVIGGGAAGMMAAITAADSGAHVTLYERNDRVGKKILATGNGKCNFANRNLSPEAYFGGNEKLITHVLERFNDKDTVSFFENAGMLIKDKNGYLYPASEQASTVLDILQMQLVKKGIKVQCERKVSKICRDKNNDKVVITSGKTDAIYDSVVIACGGSAAPKTGSDGTGCYLARNLGHTIKEVVPALVQLRCKENFFKDIAGVRAEARISLMIEGECRAEERGELQLTDYGVSGIVVFQVSRIAAYALKEKKEVTLYIDFLPDFQEEELFGFAAKRMENAWKKQTVEEFFTGMLNKKLMLLFIRLAGLAPEQSIKEVDNKKLQKVFSLCKQFALVVSDTNSFDNAQVSAGGVSLDEVTENLESKLHPGIFFAGEILDVDGKCGGYNLQWAWSSGYVAGQSAAKKEFV